jgi:hypothetical protein
LVQPNKGANVRGEWEKARPWSPEVTEGGDHYLLYNPLVIVIFVHIGRNLLQLEILRAEIFRDKVRVGVKQATSVPRSGRWRGEEDGEQGKHGARTCVRLTMAVD